MTHCYVCIYKFNGDKSQLLSLMSKSHHGGYFMNGILLVSHDFSIDDENKIYFFSNEPLGNDGGNDKFGAHINHS